MHISRSNRPRVVITMGDPSGIGPEVILKALASPKVKGFANFVIIGDSFVLDRIGRKIKIGCRAELIDINNVSGANFSYGAMRPEYGKASIEYLDRAVQMIRRSKAGSLVTGPINKLSIIKAGFRRFEGHTEYLAEETGTKDYAMMFVGRKLKITLVTRHIALKDVNRRISEGLISRAVHLTHAALRRDFGIRSPKIAVAGLNPHASEGGSFGNEEADIILPAVKKSSRSIKGLTGPVSPDVAFYEALKGRYDAVISMYHDQALIPFKMLYFDDGVNFTLGLPFVRTSPDHGTAFDIAGKGIANPDSMIEAIRLACRLSK